MKAVVYRSYGSPDVLELQEIDQPAVRDDEALVRVHAASVNPLDWHGLTGRSGDWISTFLSRVVGGVRRPRHEILGTDVAGRVETVGRNVEQFRPGDEVFGSSDPMRRGAFAEYVSVPQDGMALKPASLTFEEAAAVPMAGLTALQGLRDTGRIQPGQQVLINGASGGVGTFAVQIAKSFGAEVTGVCSTRNLDLVRSIGADRVVDYTEDDFTQNVGGYDLILDAVGKRPLSECRRALGPEGIYVAVAGPFAFWLRVLLASMVGSQKMVPMGLMKLNQEDLVVLRGLLEAGKVTPVIDRRYPLREVPEALRYLGQGHTQGKIVITV